MKNKSKEEQPQKPSSLPANKKQDDPQITNKNPRREERGSIEREIDKRTAENRTPKGENL